MDIESILETFDVVTGERREVYRTPDRIEAPNWSRDGRMLIYNGGGLLYRIPVQGGCPQVLDTAFATRCNNDHGLSPDGTQLAISDNSSGHSLICVLPSRGGTPRQVTPLGPSYWHGWSPDGETLAYCGNRNGEYDIYTIPVDGGEETRLTDAPGLDDGPDYTPDGKWIYFNSERSGVMHIWRIRPDGTDPQQITSDDAFADWFPHPSPDGKRLVLLSYDGSVEGHPPHKDVVLRMMDIDGGEPEFIIKLFGGQGSLNVPSWSPDALAFAFVSYRQR